MILNLEEETNNIIKWIKEYIKQSGAKGVVVGNSGGKDSSTVIALATKAIGKENVITIGMPCLSNDNDLEDARLVSETFNVPILEIDLSSTYNELEDKINKELIKNNLSNEISKEGKINIRPRLRMTTLYGVAQTLGYLVAGTGNKSEAFVGYTTKWGDSSSDFNPIANFTVEEVLQIGKYLGVPNKIITKAPNDGLEGKTDEEKMGVTYKQIAEYMETGKTDIEVIEKIEKLHKISEHKRNPIPEYKK